MCGYPCCELTVGYESLRYDGKSNAQEYENIVCVHGQANAEGSLMLNNVRSLELLYDS